MRVAILTNAAGLISRGLAPTVAIALKAALAIGALAIALLHAALLWNRVQTGSILEPTVILRWLGAGLLLALMGWLLGPQAKASRVVRGIALASLACLLHLSFAAPAATTVDGGISPVALVGAVAPLGVAGGLLAARGLGALAARARRGPWRALLAGLASVRERVLDLVRLPHFLARRTLALRAPPA